MIDLTDELNDLRKKLLDTSSKNKLIDYNDKIKNKQVIYKECNAEDLKSIYDQLLIQERSIEFKGMDFREEGSTSNRSYVIKSNLEGSELNGDLETLYRQSHETIESYGASLLYLAFGFLEWNDPKKPKSKDNLLSPLILIPVEIKKSVQKGNFSIYWSGGAPVTSLALQTKLKGIIPDFENDIISYFKNIEENVLEHEEWNVHYSISLDLFNHINGIMYEDLNPNNWGEKLQNNPILQERYDPVPDINNDTLSDNYEIKDLADTYQIFTDDFSKIEVIEYVKANKNLVVEGPPGTGKSQAIIGMITELMGQGKTVLFVSEKQAALDVVYNRLKQVDLGDFCLVLHNDNPKIRYILKDIEDSWKIFTEDDPSRSIGLVDGDTDEFVKVKEKLDKYASMLSETVCKRNLTLYDVLGIYKNALKYFKDNDCELIRIDFLNPENWTTDEWNDAIRALEELESYSKRLDLKSDDPWKGFDLSEVSSGDEQQIIKMVDKSLKIYDELGGLIEKISRKCAVNQPLTMKEVDGFASAAQIVMKSGSFDSRVIDKNRLKQIEWDGEFPNKVISKLRELNKIKLTLGKYFDDDVFEIDLNSVNRFINLTQNQKTRSPTYNEFKNKIFDHCKEDKKDVIENVLDKRLQDILEYASIQKYLRSNEVNRLSEYLFGIYWDSDNSNLKNLDDFTLWVKSFRELKENEQFSEEIFRILSNPNGLELDDIDEFNETFSNFISALKDVFDKLGANNLDDLFDTDIGSVNFENIIEKLKQCRGDISSIFIRTQFLDCREKCSNTVANDIIAQLDSGEVKLEHVLHAFIGNYSGTILKNMKSTIEGIASVSREDTIKKYTALEDKILLANRSRLYNKLIEEIPEYRGGHSPGSLEQTLKQQMSLGKSGMPMPIRKLLYETENLIKKIKPCFIMTPQSVAEHIDPNITFDVAIFDEASQIAPEYAMGTILRAKQLIIAGDTNQLPPSDYFEGIIENPYDGVYEVRITDMDSILHDYKSVMKQKMLKWHYRSRHESLIAASNSEIYDNSLYIHPSPNYNDKNLGLNFIYCPDTVYDRGGKRINQKEAERIAKDVVKYHFNWPEKTIGVATFSAIQMKTVHDEIDKIIKGQPGMSSFFNDSNSFFVKNLETIQGDERDVIFISIGYGIDSNGKLEMTFGTLNQINGEKRLNVIATRAKENCFVYANFTPRDLKVTETSSKGVKFLKKFMEYAESRNFDTACNQSDECYSDFEEYVYKLLTENGYEVHKQYGCGNYKIDLAVVDPINCNRYLAGILLDGLQYYSTKNTRDRERLHRDVLKGLGWDLYNVWSVDWYFEPDHYEKELLDYLSNLKNNSEKEKQTTDIGTIESDVSEENNEELEITVINDVDDSQRKDSDNNQVEFTSVSYCGHCGKKIDRSKGQNFCSYCGAKLEENI